MNLLDIVLVVIVLFCLVRGIFRGLVKELSSIIGVGAGFWAAYTFYPQLAGMIGRWFDHPAYARLVAFIALFVGVFLAIAICGVILKYLMNIVFLGWFDRVSGALFGAVKGVLIVAVLVLGLTTFLPRHSTLVAHSTVARHTLVLADGFSRLGSPALRKAFSANAGLLRRQWAAGKR